ncbi:SurA N-terminal domain-containing protein [Cellulomonas xiejunii]|uniref:SurA N-terminal domain-containing protein n=1 Tax=Cellulomonas xiejunii TaxID=2968083 RepID=A0ABY5KUD1_9CELL|nr:SurA N-terminal domain-containing protein [Cellulomonas xiejunii]MCC2322713.1 SurA N-terminal domain-containing protein [Cellulomonas xiejunii]UUI72745.1 SurA N-terminal domain-containing protein [Cellulomonas xiejunii]
MTVRRTRGRGRVVAAVVAAGGLLVGCSGQPGAAAVVDGRTITTAELATAQEELAPIFAGARTQDVLGVMITEPIALEVAADEGVGVNDEQARELLRTVAVQALGEEEGSAREFGPGALAVARYSLAIAALQDLPTAQAAADEYQERVAAADIEVNPRFGEFTDDLLVAPPTTPSWVVPEGGRNAPAEGATPAPAPR